MCAVYLFSGFCSREIDVRSSIVHQGANTLRLFLPLSSHGVVREPFILFPLQQY